LYNGSYQAFEGIGIPPDELIRPTAGEVADGLDVHIEAALDYIFDEEDDDDGTRGGTDGDNQGVCLTIEANPNSSIQQLSVFTKYVNVFGLGVYAEEGISDEKVLHSAAVLAEYLDNNEDGTIDDPALHNALLEGNMVIPIFEVEGSPAQQIFSDNGDVYKGPAPMYDNEIVLTRPLVDAFDAALEEVMHNIHAVGYGNAYPEFFALEEDSNSALPTLDCIIYLLILQVMLYQRLYQMVSTVLPLRLIRLMRITMVLLQIMIVMIMMRV